MCAVHIEATITEDNKLVLPGLPFRAGAAVEVVISERFVPENGRPPETDSDLYADPIYRIAELAKAAQAEFEAQGGVSQAPQDFAANHHRYIRGDIINSDHE